jgi:outer membrane protein OmpA-like peptidoglycan-associated protein
MKTKKLLLCLLLILSLPALGAEEFFYKQETGDKYRVLSTINENVYLNRRLHHTSEIVNRIAVEITGVQNGVARNKAVFQTGERAVRAGGQQVIFQWDKDYNSEYGRDTYGYIDIDKRYFMPVVRNVPVFPKKDLSVGDTWEIEGHEMHDFQESFGIKEPYRIPFTAQYVFLGDKEWKGKKYPAFSVSYRIFIEPDSVSGDIYPTRIMGASDQVVYWNKAIGRETAYEEEFRMVFELSNGAVMEFRGSAEAEIVEAKQMDKQGIADRITQDIEELGIKDVKVKINEDGITIALENIQFLSESAVLLASEKEKLNKIGAILKRYTDRDILISGHTAYSGTEASMMKLSEDRAGAVAGYLIDQGVRTPERIVIQGYGGTRPIADNNTEAGRVRNRRVEITILEN